MKLFKLFSLIALTSAATREEKREVGKCKDEYCRDECTGRRDGQPSRKSEECKSCLNDNDCYILENGDTVTIGERRNSIGKRRAGKKFCENNSFFCECRDEYCSDECGNSLRSGRNEECKSCVNYYNCLVNDDGTEWE